MGNAFDSGLKAGPKINTIDLYFGGSVNIDYMVEQGSKYYSGADCIFEDLTELYNSPVYGEETLYKDKLLKQCVDRNEFNGKYYATNWGGGPLGFIYNINFFKENGWKIPNTTNELISLIAEIKADNYTPFVWCGTTATYWSYIYMPWWYQLAGEEEVARFWECKDEDGNYTAEVFNSQARLQTFELLEEMVYDVANSHKKSITNTHIEAQMLLYDETHKIAMMPTGDWAENEMEINGYPRNESSIGYMRVPVASDAIYQYDNYGNKNFRYQTIQSDEKLSEVIEAVDAGKTMLDGVSEEDFAAVKKLRSYTATQAFAHNAFIPSYSNAKVGAKKFLAYLASDAALQKYYDLTGCLLPYDNKNVQLKANATEFQKQISATMQNVTLISDRDSREKIWYKTGLNFTRGIAEAVIGTSASTEKMTGREYFNYCYKYVEDNFNTFVGLIK